MLTKTFLLTQLLMTAPAFKVGDTIKVVEDSILKGCTGHVIDVVEGPDANYYDIVLTHCPKIWFKGVRHEDLVIEASLEHYKNK